MTSDFRDSLPDIRDEDNPVVWCERCQKHHRYYTFTRQDADRMIDQMALADSIDAKIEDTLFGDTE
jgi:hypothetical protein